MKGITNMEFDKDLQSIQEVRNLIAAAKIAQSEIANYDHQKIDEMLSIICESCEAQAEALAKSAVEETGFGVLGDKVLKNKLGSRVTYEYIKDMRTGGVIEEDNVKKIWSIAVPVGLVAALIPSTNPTSTVIYKTLICLKAGNAVIFSPHPSAKKCILETVDIIRNALRMAGAPQDLVSAVSIPTKEATDALMRHSDIGLILATGGPGMVRAAYSSGTPAIGVGAGNAPAFIHNSADIPLAIRRIFASKTFDNGTICASEQSIIIEERVRDQVVREAEKRGGCFLSKDDSDKVAAVLLRHDGSMNPAIIGKDAPTVARMAGVHVPPDTRVLISEHTEVGLRHPYSREKLCPVLGFFVEADWKAACDKSIQLLENEGSGHTLAIHCNDESIIREFALKKPVMRMIVNAGSALGGVGATTGLAPALTLGCGAIGGSATSDNVTPMNLVNIRRVAWGVKEIEQLCEQKPASPKYSADISGSSEQARIEEITRAVISYLKINNVQ